MGKREHYITIATAIVAIVIGIFWLLNKMDGAAGLSYSDGLEPALVCLFGLSTLAVSIFNSVDNKSEVREIDHDVFLSIPMSAVDNEITYQENRTLAREVWEAIQQHTNSDTRYCAVIDHATLTEMDDAQAANDLAELKVSSNFVLIYPEKLASSCLVEVGTAIALGIPCVIFVRDRNDLPYVLKEIGQQEQNVFIFSYEGIRDITNIIINRKDNLFKSAP